MGGWLLIGLVLLLSHSSSPWLWEVVIFKVTWVPVLFFTVVFIELIQQTGSPLSASESRAEMQTSWVFYRRSKSCLRLEGRKPAGDYKYSWTKEEDQRRT